MSERKGTQADATTDPRWHRAIPLLVAQGPYAAAEALGIDQSTLWRWRQDPAFQALFAAYTDAVHREAEREMFGLLSEAVQVVREAMGEDQDIRVRLAAAKTVISGLAKAEPQVIEVRAAPSNVDPDEANERLRLVSGGKGKP